MFDDDDEIGDVVIPLVVGIAGAEARTLLRYSLRRVKGLVQTRRSAPADFLTFTEIAEVTGLPRGRVVRAHRDGAFPSASKDTRGRWNVEFGDLAPAGFHVRPGTIVEPSGNDQSCTESARRLQARIDKLTRS